MFFTLVIQVQHYLQVKRQRAGMKGTSYTYFTTDNAKQARELIGILRESKSEVPPELEQMAMFSGGGGGGRSTFSSDSFSEMPLIFIQVVTVLVVAVEGAEAVVVVGEGAGAVLTAVDTVVVVGVVVVGVVVAGAMEVAEDATGGELRLIAVIRLILRDWSQFGLHYRSALISL